MDPILIIGGGELGLAVIQSLAANPPENSTIIALLRPSDKPSHQTLLSQLKALGVDVIYGDVAQASSDEIADLLRGHHVHHAPSTSSTVISCIGFAAGPGTQLKLAHAVLAAGIARYIPWQFGVDYDAIGRGSPQPLFDEQLDVRALLRAQTQTKWKIISTGMFTSFLFEPAFGVVDLDMGLCHALGSWETSVMVTTPEDIGRLTACIVVDREVWESSGVVYTAGDTVTYGALADKVEKALGREIQRQVWCVEELMEQLKADPTETMKKYRAVFSMGRGVAWPVEETYNYQKNIAVEDVEAWLHRRLGRR